MQGELICESKEHVSRTSLSLYCKGEKNPNGKKKEYCVGDCKREKVNNETMDVIIINTAKAFLLRDALYQRRMELCPGCVENHANQLGHMSGCGVGCLDSFEEIPDEYFEEVYRDLSVKDLDDLCRKIVTDSSFFIIFHHSDGGRVKTTGFTRLLYG